MKQLLLFILISTPILLYSQSGKSSDRLKASNKISQRISVYDKLDTAFVYLPYDVSYPRKTIAGCIGPVTEGIYKDPNPRLRVIESNYVIKIPAPEIIPVIKTLGCLNNMETGGKNFRPGKRKIFRQGQRN